MSITRYNANLICSSFITLLSNNISTADETVQWTLRKNQVSPLLYSLLYSLVQRNDICCNYPDKCSARDLILLFLLHILRNWYIASHHRVRLFAATPLGNVYQLQIKAIDKTYRARCLIVTCFLIFADLFFSPQDDISFFTRR